MGTINIGGGGIKQVIHGEAVLTGSSLSVSLPANTKKANSILVVRPRNITNAGVTTVVSAAVRGVITSDTQIDFYRGSTPTGTAYAGYELTEYRAVKSRQEGNPTYSLSSGLNTIDITITSVNTAKTRVSVSVAVSDADIDTIRGYDYYLLNSTTIRVEIYTTGAMPNTVVSWQALEGV